MSTLRVFTLVPTRDGVAHAAHLGGMFGAIAYLRWNAARTVVNWNPLQGRRRKRELVQAAARVTRWRPNRGAATPEPLPEDFLTISRQCPQCYQNAATMLPNVTRFW